MVNFAEFPEEEVFVFQKPLSCSSFVRIIDIQQVLSSDAYIRRVETEDRDSDAQVQRTEVEELNSDAHVRNVIQEELESDAEVSVPDFVTTILYPLTDEEYYLNDDLERMRFTVPTQPPASIRKIHVHVQFATDSSFNNVFWDYYSWQYPDRFSYWNGSEFVPWPLEGVAAAFSGNEALFKVQGPEPEELIRRGRWCWRVRAVLAEL